MYAHNVFVAVGRGAIMASKDRIELAKRLTWPTQ